MLTCSVVLMCSKIGSGVLLWALLWLGSKSPSTPAVSFSRPFHASSPSY